MALTESFGFQERWLRLLIKRIPGNPSIFDNVEEAQFLLGGIGNCQVAALRDWALGMGVIVKRKDGVFLSSFGRTLLEYDPELLEHTSLWSIHHKLASERDAIWFYAYYASHQTPGIFSRAQLCEKLRQGKKMSDSVFEKKCLAPLLQTMQNTRLGDDLGILIKREDDSYERLRPIKESLTPDIVCYIIVDWCAQKHRNTVALIELQSEYAPGCYLGLDSNDTIEFLNTIQDKYSRKVLTFSSTAGLNSISLAEEPLKAPLALLRASYLQKLEGMEPLVALENGIAAEGAAYA